MTARTHKTAAAAPAAAEAPAAPTFDVAALAAAAKVAPALPKVTRTSAASPFAVLVQRSWDDKTALTLPAIPADQVKVLHSTIRRGATSVGLGVSIRNVETEQGVVVTFQAKERSTRNVG
ncbi:hypothetical protein AB0M46_45625 [Dactylosporangium sp. NPDC051485]|uniref:hypothetical protein n=1 Tax=Dactylosporangium sp. NPDC051485 TaxID=3154846 RepID=UPI00341A0E57